MLPILPFSLMAALPVWVGSPSGPAQSRARTPEPYAVRGVRLLTDGSESRTLILREGRIDAILAADEDLPAGVRVLEGEAWIATPAFVDALTHAGCATPEPVIDRDRPADTRANVRIDMRSANRKGIQPGFSAADALAFEEDGPGAHREAGFGLLLSAPSGELLGGRSVLATTEDAAARDVIVRPRVFQHAAFAARGSGYPGTLMGYHAQLRQLFLDAQRHVDLAARMAEGRPGARPSFDRDLDAGAALLDGGERLVCQADSARDIRRWLRLAEEFGLDVAISGGREAWKCAGELAERGTFVFLTLDWGEEVEDPDADEPEEDSSSDPDDAEPEGSEGEADPDDPDDPDNPGDPGDPGAEAAPHDRHGIYTEPLAVRRERRRLWEEGRDSALRLYEAGVPFAFGSAGDDPADLLERVRDLVEAGLPRQAALAALTTVPAELLGVEQGYGRLEPGASASIALWDRDPFEEKARVAWLFVEGMSYDMDLDPQADEGEGPAEGVDLSGTWVVEDEMDGSTGSMLQLTMEEDGTLSGTIEFEIAGTAMEERVEGRVSGRSMTLEATFSFGGTEIRSTLAGEIDGDRVEGDMTIEFPGGDQGEQSVGFEMEREPDGAEKGDA